MKVAVYRKYGPPEVVQVEMAGIPVPRDNEVLIRVHATTVNRTDCAFRSAELFVNRLFGGWFGPKKKILGSEFAGEVTGIGKKVTLFKEGDRVFGCNIGFGAHAQYMTMAETGAITTMISGHGYDEAAPITEGAFYAWCNIRAAKISAGQQVLVNGGTGAIGSAAIQLLRYLGAEVVAVCNTESLSFVRSLGANEVIDYTSEDFTKTRKRFDVIFDAAGKSSFGKCKQLLNKKGIYMSTEPGFMAQHIFLALFTPLGGGKKVIFPIPVMKKKDVVFLKELVEAGHYKPVIDRRYSFDEIVEAYRYVDKGEKRGNVVVDGLVM